MLYLLIFFISIFLNIISSKYVKNKAEKLLINPYLPLPDLIHSNFSKINTFITDYCLFICICISLYYYYLLENVKKNILCIGLCFIIRSFSILLTIMPSCMPKSNDNDNIYKKYFVSTHDLMFSGHTLFFIGFGNILNLHFIQICGPFLVIISRQHYTIDVCVSGLIYFYVYTKIEQNIII